MLTALRNPIFEREFVALCRTKRWFVLRTLLVTFLTAATWIVLASDFGKNDRLDETGSILFFTGVFVQVGFVFFLASGLCSDLIVTERTNETLDIVLTTPLSPTAIILGKFLSRLSLIIVMVASSFPLISVALLYGGVSGRQVFGLFEITLGTILLTAGPAMLVSVYARRLGTAAVLSQIIPVAWCIGSPFLIYLVTYDEDMVVEILTLVHPLMTAVELSEGIPFVQRELGIHPATGYLIFGGTVASLCSFFAILRMRRERTGRSLLSRKRDKPGTSADGAARRRTKPSRRSRIRVGRMTNPVLWKEINLINASTSRALFWTMAVLLLAAEGILLVGAPPEVLVGDEAVHLVFSSCCAFALLLLTVVNASTSVVSERRQGTLELLHTTPITVRQIVEGKTAGVLRSVALLALVPVLHLFFAALVTELEMAQAIVFTFMFGLLVVWLSVVGVRISILAERPSRAIVRALIVFAIVMVGYPVFLSILAIFVRAGDGFSQLLLLHPMGMIAGAAAYVKDPTDDADKFLPVLILGFFLYSGLSIALFRSAMTLYRTRILGRQKRERDVQ